MQLPMIHLNGTSRESLIEGLCEASSAIEAAYQALKQTAPNGRDYYLLGSEAMRVAEAEHVDRLRRIDGVKTEVDEMTRAIDAIQ